MLSLQALESALPLAERFDQRKLLVLQRADTPLEMLVNRTRSPETVTSSHDGVSIKVDLTQLAASAAIKDPVFGDSDHDNIFDQIAVSPGLLEGPGWTCLVETAAIHRHNFVDPNGHPLRFGSEHERSKRGVSDHFPVTVRLAVAGGE